MLWVIHTRYKAISLIMYFALVNCVFMLLSLVGIIGVEWLSGKVLSGLPSLYALGKLLYLRVSW